MWIGTIAAKERIAIFFLVQVYVTAMCVCVAFDNEIVYFRILIGTATADDDMEILCAAECICQYSYEIDLHLTDNRTVHRL